MLVGRVYFCSCLVCVLLSYVYLLYYVCIAVLFFTLNARLLARSQYSEGPATGYLNTGFSWFSCAYKQMLRWFPRLQVATKCFSCKFSSNQFHVLYTCKITTATGLQPIAVNKILLLLLLLLFSILRSFLFVIIFRWNLVGAEKLQGKWKYK